MGVGGTRGGEVDIFCPGVLGCPAGVLPLAQTESQAPTQHDLPGAESPLPTAGGGEGA